MVKWKSVKVRQELLEEVESELKKEEHRTLSEFISDAIRLRLETLAKERVTTYMEQDEKGRIAQTQGQLLYTPKHIWVELTLQGTIRLGVSDYFSSQLKGIVFVETDHVGTNVSGDKPFGVVETAAGWPFVIHDMYSPIEGKIINVNKEVVNDPYILNGNAYQWIIEIKPSDSQSDKELQKLLNLEEYEKYIAKLEGLPRKPLSDSELNEIVEEIKS